MEIPAKLLRRRVLHACVLLGALVLVPELVEAHAPRATRYVPPFLLTSLAALSFGYALLVLRTQQTLKWLFPQCTIKVPLRSKKESIGEIVGAWVGVVVSFALLARWLWGVLWA